MRTAVKTTQDTPNNSAIAAPAKIPRRRKPEASSGVAPVPSAAPVPSVAAEPAAARVPAATQARPPKQTKVSITAGRAAQPGVKAAWKGMDDDGPKPPKPPAPKSVETPPSKRTPKPGPERPAIKEPADAVKAKQGTAAAAGAKELKPPSAAKAAAKRPAAARPASAKARIASVVAAAVNARSGRKTQPASVSQKAVTGKTGASASAAASAGVGTSVPAKAAAAKTPAPVFAKVVRGTSTAPADTKVNAGKTPASIPAKAVAGRPASPAGQSAVSRRIKSEPAPAGRRKPEPRDKAVVQPVLILESGSLWRMAGNNAVAYVRRASDACAILRATPGELAHRAMAVYRDRQGRAIAWQVRFETARWAEVAGMLNAPAGKGEAEPVGLP